MRRKIIICISIISVLFTGCGKIATDKLESVITEEPTKRMKPTTRLGHNVDDIMGALHFWINKEAWENDESEFLDREMTVKIYYEELDEKRDDNELENMIHFYISSEKEKDSYIHLSFIEGEHGFESNPEDAEKKKKVKHNLYYLTEKKLYFSSKEITCPNFPVSDQRKEDFLKRAKKEIKKILSNEQGIHQVYIKNFTNQDAGADVYVISNEEELWCSTIWREIEKDNGVIDTNAAFLEGGTSTPIFDWKDKDIRESFKKTLELSILEFEVKGS